MGKGSNTTTTNSGPPAAVLAAYQDAYSRAQGAASQPYQPYTGQTVAPLSSDQNAAIGLAHTNAANWQPYNDTTQGYLDKATTPLPTQMQAFLSPYIQRVVDATQAQFNNQNKIQQQGVIGNAVSQNAWGGDRSAVAQGIVAGQQQTAQAPVIAGLYDKGFQTALGGAEAQSYLNAGAAGQEASLGQTNFGIDQATLEQMMKFGAIQQQQDQANLNVPYYQYQAGQAYPFQTAGFLANIAEGLGSGAGGTSATTTPAPNVGSQILGLGAGAAGIVGATGGFGSSGWLSNIFKSGGGAIPSYAEGGDIPYGTGVPFNLASPDVSVGVVPMGQSAAPGHGGGQFSPNGSTGSSTTTSGGGDALGTLGSIAGIARLFLRRGGAIPHFDDGGSIGSLPYQIIPPSSRTPAMGISIVPQLHPVSRGIGPPRPPAVQAQQNNIDTSPMGLLKLGQSAGAFGKDGWLTGNKGIAPNQMSPMYGLATPGGPLSGVDDTSGTQYDPGLVHELRRGGIVGHYGPGGGVVAEADIPALDTRDIIPLDPPELTYGSGIAPFSKTQGVGISYNEPDDLKAPIAVPEGIAPVTVDKSASVISGNGQTNGIVPVGIDHVDNAETRSFNFGGMRNPNVPAGGGPMSNPEGWQHFDTPEAGLAAISHQLDRYASGATTGTPLTTLRQIVSTWAPPSENDTPTLISRASKILGAGPDDQLDPSNPAVKAKLIEATIRNEQGGKLPVDPSLIAKIANDPNFAASVLPAMASRGIARRGATTDGYGSSTAPSAGIAPTAAGDDSMGVGIVPRASTISKDTLDDLKKPGVNPWLALAAAGFAIAGGRSPNALQNIGAGALEGVKFLENQRQNVPEARLKTAQAQLAETEVSRQQAYRDFLAGKAKAAAAVPHLDASVDAARASVANSGLTSATPAPGGSVAPLATAQNPSPVTNPAQSGQPQQAEHVPALTPEEQSVSRELRGQIADIDARVKDQEQFLPFAKTPEDYTKAQQAINQLSIRRTELLEKLPEYIRAHAFGESAAKLPNQIETGRPASYILRGGVPVGAVPLQQHVIDPVTGQQSTIWTTPPLPGQLAGAGQQQGVTTGQGVPGQGIVTGLGPAQHAELAGRGKEATDERERILTDAQGAQNQDSILANMDANADKFWTGKFSDLVGDAKAYLRVIKPSYDDSVASREQFVKDAGNLTRTATREVSSRAAYQEVQFIQSTLPNPEMSPLGIHRVTNELRGLNDYKIAKAQALNDWMGQHNNSALGFEDNWQAKAPVTPYTFVISRMAQPERQELFAKWNQTPQGRAELQRMRSQIATASSAGWLR